MGGGGRVQGGGPQNRGTWVADKSCQGAWFWPAPVTHSQGDLGQSPALGSSVFKGFWTVFKLPTCPEKDVTAVPGSVWVGAQPCGKGGDGWTGLWLVLDSKWE